MKIQMAILIFFVLVSLAKAQDFCSCSDFKIETECQLQTGACSWADSKCSEVACATRAATELACYGSDSVILTNDCALFNGKCETTKALCSEYTSTTAMTSNDCHFAAEGPCDLDTSDNMKCKSQVPPTTVIYAAACKDHTLDPNSCTFAVTAAGAVGCYWDDSKPAGEKCQSDPTDCAGTTKAACDAGPQCVWKTDKCTAMTCGDFIPLECQAFQNSSGKIEYCAATSAGVCTKTDPTQFPVSVCHSLTRGTYHFDGSCKSCKVAEINNTNATNSTNSNGMTLVNSIMVAVMAVVPLLMN